jgi:hypothetical protein
MLYSGVDLHRRLIVVCTVDENGSIIARSRMKTDPALVSEYFRQWPDQQPRTLDSGFRRDSESEHVGASFDVATTDPVPLRTKLRLT